ncbi:MAG: peptide chain release factor N(5)-glutamine methyltransferase [Candidatus Omnitrophica bacterium]|nr:peptide chain release factor N(5)-glutamine methyltransferase [Candidatus Omnitrophota bacterium]
MNANEQILTHILKCRRQDLYTQPKKLNPDQQKLYDDLLGRFNNGEPLQYILGSCDFMGTNLLVNPAVLIPRPETEIMVESAVEYLNSLQNQNITVLDLGTGSGNIAITLAKLCPRLKIFSVDRSADALSVALKNIQLNGVSKMVELINSDMQEFLLSAWQHKRFFDMIISNPPYIPTGHMASLPHDVQQEPALALNGGIDGLDFYRIIVDGSQKILRPGGRLIMELGDGQFNDVAQIIKNIKCFSEPQSILDYTGVKRIVYTDYKNRM